MVGLYVIGLMVILSIGDLHSQVPVETKDILGEWVFTKIETNYVPTSGWPPIQVMFRLEDDSVVYYIQDEYGNYGPKYEDKFPKNPVKSGPNGLYYEKTKNDTDKDGDTFRDTYWIKLIELNKPHVIMIVGRINGELISTQGNSWGERLLKKCGYCEPTRSVEKYEGQRVK
jgi:hypothetical protein